MPTEDQRPEDMPDTSDSYERADPGKSPGLGKMDEPERVDDDRPDNTQDSTRNPNEPPAADGEEDELNNPAAVDPSDPDAHGNRPDPAKEST